MVIKIPKMLTANKRKLTEIFDYVHNVMNIPHHIIVKFPQVTYLLAVSDTCPCLALRLPGVVLIFVGSSQVQVF
jgi:hypothetical protein